VRIARFTVGDEDYRYALVEGEGTGEELVVLTGDPTFPTEAGVRPTGERLKVDDVRLLAPVVPRSKVVAVGKNYVDHAAEMGSEAPKEPLLFFKPNTAVVGPHYPIVLPRGSSEVHYEGELAVVISRHAKDVPAARAHEYILGYTIANDVTARDWQRSDGQWARAKGFDTSCPLGPYLVTELDVSDLALTTSVNGDVKQSGRTSQLIHDIPSIIEYVTAAMSLLPADVILTGTPAGVGPIVHGDRVDVTIEGIGTLSNPVFRRD
jgi:2-keto-4-pentenoate hydratase/2-oxohepta-3-ene-1,7-dioic acid hydratase in catechol pathway